MMTLISFLGKSQADSQQGYRRTRYRFPDGSERQTAYFGLALATYLNADRLILIGTPSSMWDVLIENVVGDAGEEALRLELMDAVHAGQVDESLLTRLGPAIKRTLDHAVLPLVIPFSMEFSDQHALLVRLAETLRRGERVALDVTHGFRHLAMLGLTAARYLAHTRGIAVEGLYYGALDMMQEGVAPVVELSGLAHMQEWAEALAAYEASGDFSRFAPLLQRDGLDAEKVELLRRGWGFLAMSNVAGAARAMERVYHALGEPLGGTSELFRKRLQETLRWVVAPTLAEKQRLLALQALNRGDFLRAALFGLESLLSREVQASGGDPLDYAAKQRIAKAFRAKLHEGEHPDWKREAYCLLTSIRNACAHGTVPRYAPHAQLLQNPSRLREELDRTFNRLINTA